jgi:hypothetical protein
MITRIFSVISIVFVLTIGCLSQSSEKWQRTEDEKGADETLKTVINWRKPAFDDFVESFLPMEKEAWTIAISQNGGFLGESVRLVGLVNSHGRVGCNDNKIQGLADEYLNDLSNFIQSNDLKKLKKSFKPTSSFCNDCYITTLTINYRPKKNRTKTFEYSWFTLPDSSPEISAFYKKAKSYTACQ